MGALSRHRHSQRPDAEPLPRGRREGRRAGVSPPQGDHSGCSLPTAKEGEQPLPGFL